MVGCFAGLKNLRIAYLEHGGVTVGELIVTILVGPLLGVFIGSPFLAAFAVVTIFDTVTHSNVWNKRITFRIAD